MDDTRFKQVALNKLDTIYRLKTSMDEWLIFWAAQNCPVQVGDKYPIKSWLWRYDTPLPMVVSKISAKLIPDRKFVWWIEGWVELPDRRELRTETFEMEEDNEK